MKIIIIILSSFCLFWQLSFAEDVIVIESTISGNEEQPRVVTIVPWKEPPLPNYLGEEINDIGDPLDVFQLLDRTSFSREKKYIATSRASISSQ